MTVLNVSINLLAAREAPRETSRPPPAQRRAAQPEDRAAQPEDHAPQPEGGAPQPNASAQQSKAPAGAVGREVESAAKRSKLGVCGSRENEE
ncbi:hypothetical protein FE257_005705 [Aspergillus nanangensis]|uniref:Uncharacterized protein n=1 Tax=Aspergillus nanangensis TaxID=2582783 RepID=A0AAD4CQ24_ASPNN|nr:hypothetical protein FE257_005705 [Aspergillus nanangensis]